MTHRTARARLFACALLIGALAGCDTLSGPVDGSQLMFIRQADTAPALAVTELSFWVTAGQGKEVRMPYVNGYECLRFKVPGNGLSRYPDGRPFEDGDSVRITIRVAHTGFYDFEFQPAGLRFDPDHPAELRISYEYADADTDGDGDVDARDEINFENAAIWRQEATGDPWTRIGTARLDDLDEFRAELNGITRYALSSN
jgi:hypothetical protein